jgi:hypothetical protein
MKASFLWAYAAIVASTLACKSRDLGPESRLYANDNLTDNDDEGTWCAPSDDEGPSILEVLPSALGGEVSQEELAQLDSRGFEPCSRPADSGDSRDLEVPDLHSYLDEKAPGSELSLASPTTLKELPRIYTTLVKFTRGRGIARLRVTSPNGASKVIKVPFRIRKNPQGFKLSETQIQLQKVLGPKNDQGFRSYQKLINFMDGRSFEWRLPAGQNISLTHFNLSDPMRANFAIKCSSCRSEADITAIIEQMIKGLDPRAEKTVRTVGIGVTTLASGRSTRVLIPQGNSEAFFHYSFGDGTPTWLIQRLADLGATLK